MDQATIMRILERQGAENTPDNINRIIQAAASDPSILERYSMGTAPAQTSSGPGRQDIRGGGGLDDNAALLNLQGRQPTIERKSSTQTYEPAPPAPAQRAAPPPSNRGRSGAAAATEPSVGPQPPPGAGKGGYNWFDFLMPSLLALPGYRGKPGAPGQPWEPGGVSPRPNDFPRITQQGPEAVYQGPMSRGDLDVRRPNTPPVQVIPPDRTGGMPTGPTPGMTPNEALAEANARRMNQPRLQDTETPGGTLRPGGAATNAAPPQVEAPPARPGITGGNPPTYPSGAPTMGSQPGLDLENQRIDDERRMKEEIARQNAANKPSTVRPGKRPPRVR